MKEASPLSEITSTKLNRQVHVLRFPGFLSLIMPLKIPKRELTLVDKSGFSVRMTLWGKQAEQYNAAEPNPVIAFKGVKVGDFGGTPHTA